MKKAVGIMVLAIMILLGGYFITKWGSEGEVSLGRIEPDIYTAGARDWSEKYEAGKSIGLMIWDMNYLDAASVNHENPEEKEFSLYKKIEEFAQIIKENPTDLLFAESLDFESKRSLDQDQMIGLQWKTKMGFSSPIITENFKSKFYPSLNFENKVRSGSALISRIELKDRGDLYLFEKKGMNWFKKQFSPTPFFQAVKGLIGKEVYWILQFQGNDMERKEYSPFIQKWVQEKQSSNEDILLISGNTDLIKGFKQVKDLPLQVNLNLNIEEIKEIKAKISRTSPIWVRLSF